MGIAAGYHLFLPAVFLYCRPDCPGCPANTIRMGQAIWATWASIKKYNYKVFMRQHIQTPTVVYQDQ